MSGVTMKLVSNDRDPIITRERENSRIIFVVGSLSILGDILFVAEHLASNATTNPFPRAIGSCFDDKLSIPTT